jgi:hypothetical protein
MIEDAYWGVSVVHSNMHGVNVQPQHLFMRDGNRIIHSVEIPDSAENIRKLMELLKRTQGNCYDTMGLLFAGVMLFCRKALGLRKWPKQNLWQSSGMYLCTEFVSEYLEGKADSMITPHELYERIK